MNRISVVLALLLLAGSAVSGSQSQSSQSPDADLPDGPGKVLLMNACTACHEVTEVTKFKGFYTKDEWRDIVITMVKYGAVVKESEVPVLVDYLFANLGKKN